MKKLLLFSFAAAIFATTACDKKTTDEPIPEPVIPQIEVTSVQRSLALNATATWCGHCGSWGSPALKTAIATHGDKAVILKCNGSPSCTMFSQTAQELVSFMNITGWPNFSEGVTNHATSTSAWNAAINATIAKPAAAMGVGIKNKIEGTKLKIETRVKAFSALPAGKYNLAVYILEDGVVATQNGASDPNYKHDNLVRGAVTPTFGVELKNGAITTTDEFKKEFTYNISGTQVPAKLKVAAVLFQMGTNGKPIAVINCNMVK